MYMAGAPGAHRAGIAQCNHWEPRSDPFQRCDAEGLGRAEMNHDIGLLLASSLTLVGLTRVSIGPAISVIERGCAG